MNYSFSIYSALEREVVSLFNIIHISDVQLNVFSLKISDLILRCCVEIESLSKKIYNDNGFNTNGKQPDKLKFDYDCLKKLDDEWGLCSKKLVISNPFIYLSDSAREIVPFQFCYIDKNKETSVEYCKWKKAYMALKHDRFNNMEQGNLRNLFYSLGALFLLVVFDLRNLSSSQFPLSYTETEKFRLSEIFILPTFYLLPKKLDDLISDESCFWGDKNDVELRKNELKQAVAIVKYTESFYIAFCIEYFRKSGSEFIVNAFKDSRVSNYIQKQINNNNLPGSRVYEIIIKSVGQEEFIKMLRNTWPTALTNIKEGEFEIVANRNQEFYPKIQRPKELY